MTPGKIILLTGAVCADKRSIAQALQAVLPEPYLYIGLEQLTGLLPALSAPPSGVPSGQAIIGLHQTIAALSCAGNHVTADQSLIEAGWTYECTQMLGKLPLWVVAVRCPATAGTASEAAYNDRTPDVYDLAVDPAQYTPRECALQIKQRMQAGPPPLAIHWLKAWSAPAKHRGWLRGCTLSP